MDLKQIARADFQEFITMNATKWPKDMIDALKHHERTPKFIDNIAKELQQVSEQMGHVDRMQIKDVVYSLTEFFLYNLKRHHDEKVLSNLEVQRVKETRERAERLDQELSEAID